MSWKDYFYFQKRDKVAIILLLILIVMSGGIYIATRPVSVIKKESEISTIDTAGKFNTNNQQTTPTQDEKGDEPEKSFNPKQTKYPYQEKLKNGETIELNSSDTSALKKIPGIGTGFANKIVRYRNALGGYISITQLKEVWGLDNDLYDKIEPYITITPKVKKIRVNTDDFQSLNKHPYISYKQAQIITDIRERKGHIESLQRLSLLDEFTEVDIEKLRPYLSFD